ncbi:MAG: hypothetical protein GY710_15835 [Desulfobacteraceae bacterium]|nr:hypothetical protein [Desulfobacteraceae bacterium]
MTSNRDLYKQLQSGRSIFYLADFHVHSPASADIRLSPRFENLPDEHRKLLDSLTIKDTTDQIQYETKVLEAFPPNVFYDSILNRRNEITEKNNTTEGLDWAILAITDHNVCEYACKLSSHAWTLLKDNRIIIMPGIELSVKYIVPGTEEYAKVHLLCIFRPNTSSSDIRIAITNASNNTSWKFGEILDINSLPEFVYKLRHHSEYPSICIAAHVGSSSGVQNETKNVMLSRLDAAIARIRAEIESGVQPDTIELEKNLESLLEQHNNHDDISLEILSLIGQCGFDALQIRGKHDEVHYRRLHRYQDDFGRAVPIICSDAHSVLDVFVSNNQLPHIKLSSLSNKLTEKELFESVKNSLRLGETRISFLPEKIPLRWIAGIEIRPDTGISEGFWPFEKSVHNESTFTLSFSRNLNCIIGGRGSGKSAALEALSFVSSQADFENQINKKDENLPDFYSRAKATLSMCDLTLCWQFIGTEKAESLKKGALFASRYFDQDGHHKPILYSDINNIELLPEQVPEISVQYYRLGDIEKQADPKKLRNLFDKICGKGIQEYKEKIDTLIEELSIQRFEIVKLSEKMVNLTKEGAPLREYVHRKKLFDDVNVLDVREAYAEIDITSGTEDSVIKALEDWRIIFDDSNLSEITDATESFFDSLHNSTLDEKNNIKKYHERLEEISRSGNGNEEVNNTYTQKIYNRINLLDGDFNDVEKDLNLILKDISKKGKDARDNLAAKGFPTGGKGREAKKKAYDKAVEDLKSYCDLLDEWNKLINERKVLAGKLKRECEGRSDLRKITAEDITNQLKRDLETSVLQVEADAQPQVDKDIFEKWLNKYFTPPSFRYRDKRFSALLEKGLEPSKLCEILLQNGTDGHEFLIINRSRAEYGGIDESNAKKLVNHSRGRYRLECETNKSDVEIEVWNGLPNEIKKGLYTFAVDEKSFKLDAVLQLDEIIFDDLPDIRLNDRPTDPKSKPRSIKRLSPGQRCSAILPILLLTGLSPLIIDQPEDNMDNRLIRQVIVNILSSIKLRRQVILATHNPNLPVLGDVEQAIILQGVGEKECQIKSTGDLDSGEVVHHLTEVMEGGREAFQYRQTIYQAHWPGPIDLNQTDFTE